MKFNLTILFFYFLFPAVNSEAQKTLSDGSLVYNMSVETGSGQPKMADMLDGATTTIYLKGDKSKSELISSLGREATIYDASKGTGVILKDYSGQKLMITLTPANWEENNRKFDGIVFENTDETAKIAGFNCKKAIAKLKNGTSFTVFYTTEVKLSNKSYDAQFKTLPGLPVQYEMESGKMKFKFTLSKISYNSVPASTFEIPKSGYRVLTYEETKGK
jgi:GLPGLI family protein